MIESQSRTDPRIGELDDLVRVAETSLAALDAALESAGYVRTQFYVSLGGLTLCGATVILFGASGATDQAWRNLGAFIGLLGLALFGFAAYERYRRLVTLRRKLKVESDALASLVSLIDGQYNRVRELEMFSPVVRATLDIRIRRLDRSFH